MSDRPERSDRAGGPSGFESVVDDVVGVDFKLPRTLVDLTIRPGRVADAALAHDHSRYTRPLRVFLAIVAVQAILYGWLGIYDAGALFSAVDDPRQLAVLEARLAEIGLTIAEADEIAARWLSWSSGPVNSIASLISMLVIWATRPSLGPFKSLLLYLVASNASSVVALPLLVGGALLGTQQLLWASALGFVAIVVYSGLVLHKRAADTKLGLAWRLVALTVAWLPIFVVIAALSFAVVEVGFRLETGLWRIGLLIEAAAAAAAAAQGGG